MNETQPTPATETSAAKHELKDVNVRAVGLMALGLALSIIVAFGIVSILYESFAKKAARVRPPAPALFDSNRQPPEPRLQADPGRDLQEMRAMEDAILHSYGWVDPGAGVARIPIGQAMKLLVERSSQTSSPQQEETKR